MKDYWLRQNEGPLFEDLLWSRPQNKKNAGSLLILGGHVHNLMAPIKAYETAINNGIGSARVVMPDAVPESVSAGDEVVTVQSSHSGGISKDSIDDIRKMLAEVDVALWPGAVGGDSETTQLLDSLIQSESITTVLTGDSLDNLLKSDVLLKRKSTHLVLTLAQLRSLGTVIKLDNAIVSDIQLTNLVDTLGRLSEDYQADLTTLHENQLVVASGGLVSTTKLDEGLDKEDFKWRVDFATISAVLMAQFPKQRFEAVTTAAWLFREANVRV